MTAIPIASRINESKYTFQGSPRLINCYAEKLGDDAKAPFGVVPAPGMALFKTQDAGPGRGAIYLPDLDCAYLVHPTSVYKLTYDGTTATSIRIGPIPGTDVVQLSRNQHADGPQISIHCAAGEFFVQNDAIGQVTDTDLPEAVSQDHAGGYTAYGIDDRRVFISGLNDCATIDGTDYATAEQTPDPLVRVKGDRGDLFIFKKRSMEQWRNTGQADFPFEPMPIAVQKGLLAANALAAFDNTLAWPADDSIVYRLAGSAVQRISTHGIERTIESDGDPEQIIGFSHEGEGHSFFTLTGDEWTRAYDAATQLWHARESYKLNRWRARFPFRAWGKTLVQDELTGNIYELDKNTFAEGSDPLVWGVDTPIVHAFPNGGVVDALHLDFATGVGVLPATAQGYSPKVMVSWSTDGGNTFKGNRVLSLGRWGDRVRVTTRRLGRFGPQGIQFRIRISDPVIRSLIAADVEARPLKR